MAQKPEGKKAKPRTKTGPKKAGRAGACPKTRKVKTDGKTKARAKKPIPKPPAKKQEKRPEGRPTKYDPALHLPLAEAWAAVGLTEIQIAAKLGISKSTLTNWKRDNPEFLASLKKGKELPDDLVEASLFARATGYNFKAVKIFMPANAKAPVYAPYVEHCPPDTTAQFFWLKNRRPADWRDKQEVDATVHTDDPLTLVLNGVKPPEPKP
jgi:transcriptional regulator with XRE-family HTH domain